jgi:hypothetical protein
MLGDLIGEFKGKVTGIRVLFEGKIEISEQASGSILGYEATWLATSISTQRLNGTVTSEGEAIVTTDDGDVVMISNYKFLNLNKGFIAKRVKSALHSKTLFLHKLLVSHKQKMDAIKVTK